METPYLHSRVKNNNRDFCCVKECEVRADKNLNLSFHTFPKPNKHFDFRDNCFGDQEKIDVLKAWKIALKKNDVTPRMKVCSLHFRKEDFILPDFSSKRRVLKKNSVPTCNLPTIYERVKNRKEDRERLERRMKRNDIFNNLMTKNLRNIDKPKAMNVMKEDIFPDCSQSQLLQSSPMGCSTTVMKVDAETQTDESIFMKKTCEATVKEFKDSAVQVNTLVQKRQSFVHSIETDAELSTATGIQKFQVLEAVVELVKKVHGTKCESNRMKSSIRDRIIMVFTKLKQNLSYTLLSMMFNTYSAKHFQRVFEKTIKMLSKALRPVIRWQSREEILSNLPNCFAGFEDTRVVLDCTEVFIQQPKQACCQVNTYSHYKSHVTCKIMTGVAPSGTITFLSRVYGGRVSDTTIFEQSDMMNLLDPGDGIMVDRGFLIDKYCEINRWKCIRPPYLKDKKQFSKEDSCITAKIASARVHIERSNQRIKTYKILGSVLPGNLVVLLEDIFIVICATINLSSPILKDDKFMIDVEDVTMNIHET